MKSPPNYFSTLQSLYLFSFTHSFVDIFTTPFLIHSFFFLFLMSQHKVFFLQGAFLKSHPFIYSNHSSIPSYFNSAKVSVMRINESGSVKIEIYYNISTHLESFWLIKNYYLFCSVIWQFFEDTTCSFDLPHESEIVFRLQILQLPAQPLENK